MLKLPALTDPCIGCDNECLAAKIDKENCRKYCIYQTEVKSRQDILKAVYKWLEKKVNRNEITGRVVLITGTELDKLKKLTEVT